MAKFAQRPKRLTRSYKIEHEAIADLDALAEELGVFHSALVNLLLKRALAEVRSGQWKLEAKPVAYEVAWSDTRAEMRAGKKESASGASSET